MKREVKFRGKRKDNGEWVIGNLFIPDKLVAGIYICPETTSGDFMPGFEDGDKIEDFKGIGISLGHFHEVNPESVGQFTGLLDKNEKEIFEGDILKENQYGIYEVIWDNNYAKFKLDWTRVNKYIQYPEWNRGIKMDIIGNIYENPDLLTNP